MLAICSHEHFHENIPSLSHARYPLHVYSETSVAYRKQPVEGFYRAKWSIITTESSAPKNPLLDGLYRWPRVREKHLSGHHRLSRLTKSHRREEQAALPSREYSRSRAR